MKYKDFETLKSNEDFKRVYTKKKVLCKQGACHVYS